MTTYPGGKAGSGVYQTIINLLPPHRVYIEPFLGAGAVMRAKKPAALSIGIDIDPAAISLWTGSEVPNLQLIHGDSLDYLRDHNDLSGDTLIYLDPPYLLETRSCQRALYNFEFFTREQHTRLLDVITRLNCMVIISGYYSDLYATRLAGWQTHTYQARTRGGRMGQEWLWMNFQPTLELHDYKYLGNNFRERERIKRRRERWKARLVKMTPLERQAMLSAIDDLRAADIA